jgi:hypothetical protein
MLENTRKQGASVILYIIFGVLIAAFVLGINPGGQGEGGCRPASNTWLTVDGSKVHKNDYYIAYANRFNPERGKARVHAALEMLIRRELLAQAAADRGLRVTDDIAETEIMKGHFFFGGIRLPLGEAVWDYQRSQICDGVDPPAECKQQCMLQSRQFQFNTCPTGYLCAPDDNTDLRGGGMPMGTCDARCTPGGNQCGPKEICTEEGRCAYWNNGKFKSWLSQLNVSQRTYVGEQARNLQANLMQEVLTSAVRVSRDEAREAFIAEKTTVKYDTVTFSPASYRTALRLTDTEIQRYLDTHEEEVKAKFKADERNYQNVKPQLKLRKIKIASAEPGPDGKKPSAGLPIEEAKAKLEAARTAIAAGKKKFADAARELSTDEADRASGGLHGWQPADNAGLGEKAVSDAVTSLKPGEMTPVITTEQGAYLVLVEDARPKGDAKHLVYDDVKHEIAAELARDVWSKEAAKRAALDAHAEASKSGKPLAEIYGDTPIDETELKRQLQQQLQQQPTDPATPAPPAVPEKSEKTGQAEPDFVDIPVAWKQPGDAGGGAAAGETGGETLPAKKPEPAKPAPIERSSEQLPAIGEVTPRHQTHGPVPRGPMVPGVSKELVPVLFDQLAAGALAPSVHEAPDGSYVLVQLVDKGVPDLTEFDSNADRYVAGLRIQRASSVLQEWLRTRCEALVKDEKIGLERALQQLLVEEEEGKSVMTYRPCQSFQRGF